MMRKEVTNSIEDFSMELEKFSARWHQLKPANIDADADKKTCNEAVNNIKERRAEFDELAARKEKLM